MKGKSFFFMHEKIQVSQFFLVPVQLLQVKSFPNIASYFGKKQHQNQDDLHDHKEISDSLARRAGDSVWFEKSFVS